MKRTQAILILLVRLLAPLAPFCAAQEPAQSPEDLIARARSQEELRTEGTPPMTMRAEIQISGRKGDLLRGEYTLLWASPSRWREEIRFSNYVRVRVGDVGGYWQTSALNYQPQQIFQLDTLLHLNDAARIAANQGLGKLKNRKSG